MLNFQELSKENLDKVLRGDAELMERIIEQLSDADLTNTKGN